MLGVRGGDNRLYIWMPSKAVLIIADLFRDVKQKINRLAGKARQLAEERLREDIEDERMPMHKNIDIFTGEKISRRERMAF